MTHARGKSGETAEGAGAALDIEALRAKYREEREKRLRADAVDQFIEIAGIHAHFERDPWVEGELRREPVHDEVDVVLIGGGFGGLITGARLRQSGIESLRIIEKGGDFGGTWYWNRFPGVACDVESFCYLPLIEEVGTKPTERYSAGAEIFEHCRALARRFDLYRGALFRTEVRDLAWDEAAARWIVQTHRGDILRARFVCLAAGFLEKPKLPGIPGIETFEGKSFHTSRWDYAYTGGDANGNLTGLRDKRVGIIGTGATAVQCVPHLGASAKQLYVFQRTPAGVGARNNGPVDPAFTEHLAPGWQKRRIENFQVITIGGHEEQDLVDDGWTDVPKRVHAAIAATGKASLSTEELAAISERIDHEVMEEVRARIARVVADPATAEALKPYYRPFCKRPCFHDEYLPTFNRPNVKLVDTKGRGVERITKKGVVVDGQEIELDCLIYATGFEVATEYVRRSGFETTGRGGITLSEKWRDRYRTFHGLHLHRFPNAFMLSIAQSGYTLNFPYLIDVQAQQIAYVVGEAIARGARTIEASAAAEDEWCAILAERSATTDKSFAEQCTPSYYNDEGKPDAKSLDRNFFVGGPTEFADLLAAWRAEGKLRGLELVRQGR